jgi:hypothetical protein
LIWHWLVHVTGSDYGAPYGRFVPYDFVSGTGGILLVSGSILSVPYTTWRRHVCHEPWCWRLGRHPVEGTPFASCRRHHPALKDSKPARGHMTAAWHRARSGVNGERLHRPRKDTP